MYALAESASQPINTYNNGQPYRPARGRFAPRESLEDHLQKSHAVVDLPREQPSAKRFLQVVVRELKIRCYQPKTIKSYRNAIRNLLRWFGGPPHLITREDVRCYLEVLVDGGAGSSWLSTTLSAIRTLFDKFCYQSITLGLATPKRAKKLPVVLSREEVIRLLEAAVSLRDKLLLGLMYATGVRVSEVVRLRWRDFDFDRLMVNVWQGKGRTDRVVMLPETFRCLLKNLSQQFEPGDFVFPGDKPGRHLSPRTVQRVMKRSLRLAGIGKVASCHSLRHGFACHLLEDGTDIRFIQQFLGHAKLETTTIYTKVAVPRQPKASPLDALFANRSANVQQSVDRLGSTATATRGVSRQQPAVGRMKIHMRPDPHAAAGENVAQVTIEILTNSRPVYLTGIRVSEPRHGWLNLQIPPLESWSEPLLWLTPWQRDRIESAEFYDLLQQQIQVRYRSLFPG